MSTSSILYDITIYRAYACLSRPYKYSLRFSESGRILKQSIIQIKLSWSVNSVSEIFHISQWYNRHASPSYQSWCCIVLPCGFNICSGHIAVRNRSSLPCDFELALFQSVTKYVNTDTYSPQNFSTFLENDLTEKFKKSAVASAIAIHLFATLCFSCFVPFLVSFRYFVGN